MPDSKAPRDSMEKLHGKTDFTQFAAYSWNIFRYVGDYLHLFGVMVLLATIVFTTRYLDLFDHSQSTYLVFFKLTYIFTSMAVLGLFMHFANTYERRHDTFNIVVVVVPCATAALLLTNEYSMLEILWTFSEFVEGFAMVPQYIFCYRSGPRDWGQSLYVISLGGYRVFYALNWIYKKIQMPHYSDIQSWIGGIIEIMFFVDFLNYRFTGNSMLRTAVLSVDTKINEISDKVEMKVLGSSRAERVDTEGGEMRRRKKVAEDEQMESV